MKNKQNAQYYRKLLVISLVLGLVFSSFGSIALSYAKQNDKPSKPDHKPMEVLSTKSGSKSKIGEIKLGENNQEKYSLSPEEVDAMYKQGYGIQDMFKTVEIANQYDIQPKEIIAQKEKDKKNWNQVEDEIYLNNHTKSHSILKEKYSYQYSQLDSKPYSEREKMMLLTLYSADPNQNFELISEEFQSQIDKNKWLDEKIMDRVENRKPSKEKMEQYELSEEEAIGLNDDLIDQIASAAAKDKKAVKQYVMNYQKAMKTKKEGVGSHE